MSDDGDINTLFVLPQLVWGGSETLVYNLAKTMNRNRFSPSVVYLSSHGSEALIEEFEKNRVQVFNIPKTANIDFGVMRKLARKVVDHRIKIINAHHFISMFYGFHACKKNKQTGLIYTEHSRWEVERIPFKWRILGHYLLNQIDGIVAVSDEIAEAIQKKFFLKRSKITTIENGVDLARFGRIYDRTALRSRFGISADEIVIGMIANFRKIKNHIFLLKAFRALIDEYTGLKLMLVGQGFEGDPEGSESEIREFVKNNSMGESVLFMGYRTDIPELLAIADIFCLTSLNEGLPISLIEAMAAGLPVVGTDVDGIRTIVKHGHNGFLVDPSDEASLNKALRALLCDAETRMMFGKVSRQFANKSYSIEHCAEQYQDVFLRVYTERHKNM